MMIRHIPVLVLSLAVSSTNVAAEEGRAVGHRGTLEQQRACRGDVLRYCRNMQDQEDRAIAECLKAHVRQLSSACRQVLKEGG
jgi:hypothetical protein